MLRLNGIKSLTVEARSNVLQAAGYTTRRYVKLLPRFVEPLFSVCPARSSRRQEGVLLQGHPRPWPVAKPRTLWVPAHNGARVVSRWGGRCCASILPPPRTPALDKEAPAEPCPHCRRSRAGSFRRQRPGSRQSRQPRLCRLHSAVRLRRVYLYLPAIPPHLRRGEPRRKCSGRAGGSRSQLFNCFRLLAQRMSGSAFGGLWPPRLIALSAHNHAFASARHPLRRWVPFSLGFAHGRYPFDSALSRARWARTPESVCAHILPVFAGGREPGVSRPLYRQSPSFLTR